MEAALRRSVHVFPDTGALNAEAASMFFRFYLETQAKGEIFHVALAGGSTPKGLYEMLAMPPYVKDIKWNGVEVFFGDERCVPPEDEQSNYRMAHDALLKHVGARVHRIKGELPPEEAAREYENEIKRALGEERQAFDLVLLGMGADGHTASLFPGIKPASFGDKLVSPVFAQELNTWRVTLTYSLLNQARRVLFLVTGKEKATVLKEILAAPSSAYPAGMIAPQEGEVAWLLDQEAASGLEEA